jgi:hypothetical protein
MWCMPWRLLRWYAYQLVRLEAIEELRALDHEIIQLVRDPMNPIRDMRERLEHVAAHGFHRGEQVLTPADARRKMQAAGW